MNIEEYVNDYLQEHRHDVLLNPYNGLVDFAKTIQDDLGWISVKDRLPDTTEYVFTCIKMDGIPQCVGFHYYKDGKWWEGYEEDSVGAVEYWMRIPQFKEARQ